MVKIQDHFHLDLATNVDGDGAPTARYKARSRTFIPVAKSAVSTSWTGVRQQATIVDDTGAPVLHTDYKYRVLCTASEFDTVSALLGRTVKFVDFYHPDDTESHASCIKDAAVMGINEIAGLGQQWLRIEFNLELMEIK
jgi:hypothetical protein